MSGRDEITQRYLELLRQGRDDAAGQRLRDALGDLLMTPRLIEAAQRWYGFEVREDPAMPPDELHLEIDGRRVGRVTGISFTAREPGGEPRQVRMETRQIRSFIRPVEAEGELTEEGRRALNEAIKASYESMRQEIDRRLTERLRDAYWAEGLLAVEAPPLRYGTPDTIPYEPKERYISSVFGFGGPVVMEPAAYVHPMMDLSTTPPARRKVPGRVVYETYDVPVSRGGRRRHRRERKKRGRG